MRPKKRLNLGANVADQRYCAPTVGSLSGVNCPFGEFWGAGFVAYIDAISASEVATSVVPIPAKMEP